MRLEVDDIHCFYGLSHVVQGVSLDVGPGEIVSLLGRNGAGKTTTISAVVGLLRPKSGDVRIGGQSIMNLSCHEIRGLGIGWVPQGRRLFAEQTVRENLHVAMLRLDARQRKQQFESAYGMFPRLLERRETRAGNLSGGEQQMLAIARALIGSPRLLILDEPTEGLSPLVINDILSVIGNFARAGGGVLLAEQNVRVALAIADRHYILDQGVLEVATNTENLARSDELLSKYLGVKT